MTSTQQLPASTSSSSEITLKGSVDIVTEFFHYALNNILFQRCIYPPSLFHFEKKYGLSLMVTKDPALKEYLNHVLSQLDKWLLEGRVQQLVLLFLSAKSGEVRERWTFNVEQEERGETSGGAGAVEKSDTRKSEEPHLLNDRSRSTFGIDEKTTRGERSRSPRRRAEDEGKERNTSKSTKPMNPKEPPTSKPQQKKKTMSEITREIQAIMRQITASVSFLPVIDEIMAFDLLVYCDSEVSVPTAWEESGKCVLQNSQEVRLASFSTTVHKVDSMVAYRLGDEE